jgi:hypothetical protein
VAPALVWWIGQTALACRLGVARRQIGVGAPAASICRRGGYRMKIAPR